MTTFLWNLWLALAWTVATGQFTMTNLVFGLILGYVILLYAQRMMGPSRYFAKVSLACRFAFFYLWQMMLSNLRVAYDVATPTHYMRPGVLAIPLSARTDAEITALANLITLTPGSLSLDVTDYFLLGALNVYPVHAAMTPEAADTAFAKIIQHIGMLHGRYDCIFIDSLTSFVSQVPESHVLSFLSNVKEYVDENMTVFFTMHSHAFDEAMFMRIRSLCDAHLRLRTEEVRDQLMKVLEVAKVRGAEKSTGNIINFDVEPGLGMRIIPVSSAKA